MNQADWDQTVQIGIDSKILAGPPDEGARRDDLTAAALGLIEGDTVGADFQKAEIVLQEGGV